MSNGKDKELPLYSQENCEDLLFSCSINAFHAYKSIDKSVYDAEINTLAKICADLLTHYNQTPQSIISRMERTITEEHSKEITEINCQIKHLFNIRKQAPADTSYGEQEIMKLTNKITALEALKILPIKDAIEGIVYTSFNKAIKEIGAKIPASFNLNQYEYCPLESELTHKSIKPSD
jgi:hypothetical protein